MLQLQSQLRASRAREQQLANLLHLHRQHAAIEAKGLQAALASTRAELAAARVAHDDVRGQLRDAETVASTQAAAARHHSAALRRQVCDAGREAQLRAERSERRVAELEAGAAAAARERDALVMALAAVAAEAMGGCDADEAAVAAVRVHLCVMNGHSFHAPDPRHKNALRTLRLQCWLHNCTSIHHEIEFRVYLCRTPRRRRRRAKSRWCAPRPRGSASTSMSSPTATLCRTAPPRAAARGRTRTTARAPWRRCLRPCGACGAPPRVCSRTRADLWLAFRASANACASSASSRLLWWLRARTGGPTPRQRYLESCKLSRCACFVRCDVQSMRRCGLRMAMICNGSWGCAAVGRPEQTHMRSHHTGATRRCSWPTPAHLLRVLGLCVHQKVQWIAVRNAPGRVARPRRGRQLAQWGVS